MQCTRPVYVNGISVPCGRCEACLSSRAREWSVRLLHELETAKDAVFVTLTYSDQDLPGDGSLDRGEFPRFMKRLRKLCPGRRFKYYACGEYGGRTGRPHYHAILFGLTRCGSCRCCSASGRARQKLPEVDSGCELLERAWPFGHVDVGEVTEDSCFYVADYLGKSYGEVAFGGRVPAFSLMSKSVGREWVRKHQDRLVADLGIRVRGRMIALPRYYQRILGREVFPELQEQFTWLVHCAAVRRGARRDQVEHERLSSKHGDFGVAQAAWLERRQRERNSAARRGLRRREL